jgi:tetratricopeptide (TPR) repeat protein
MRSAIGAATTIMFLVLTILSSSAGPLTVASTRYGSSSRQGRADHPMMLSTEVSVSLLDRARKSILMLRFEEADSLLDRLESRPDGGPAAAYHRTIMALLNVFFVDSEEAFEAFFSVSDHFSDVLDESEKSAGREYLRAEGILLRTLVWIKKRDYFKSVLAGNAAFKAFRRLIDDGPVFAEAWKGMGLLHMTIGSIPRTYRKYLNFFGYSGTLAEGIAELTRAAGESKYAREEALIYLSTLDLYDFPTSVRATETYGTLWTENEGSPLLGVLYADALVRRRRAPDAEAVLRLAMEQSDRPSVVKVDYLDYYLGLSIFLQNRFPESRQWFLSFLDEYTGTALKMQARLRIGEANEMEGDRAAALAWYRKVVIKREYEEDAAAGKRAADLISRPMDDTDRDLLRAHNDFSSGRLDVAASFFTRIYESHDVLPVQRGEAAYRLGRLFDFRSESESALKWYALAVREPGDQLARWAPWSLLYMARIEAGQDRLETAREHLVELMKYDGNYDFRPSIERKATLLLEQIDSAGQ